MSDDETVSGTPDCPTPRAEGRWRAVEGILQTLHRSERLQNGEKALARLREDQASQSAAARTEGRWRAVEGVLQLLRREQPMEAGEKALAQLRQDSGVQTETARADEQTSSPYVHELMRRYVSGELGALELDALQILLRCDPQARKELAQVCEELGRTVPEIARVRPPQPISDASNVVQAPNRRPITRRHIAQLQPATSSSSPFRPLWLVAAGLLLAATAVLIWRWGGPPGNPRDADLQQKKGERRLAVLRRLEDLDRQAEELAAAKRAVTRRPRPVPAPPETKTESPQKPEVEDVPPPLTEEELALRQEDAEKCARLLKLRRLLLETELSRLKKLDTATGLDEEPDEPEITSTQPATPPPAEVGRVVFVEREAVRAVLLRGDAGTQVALANGTKLLPGDRIETERGSQQACASLELGEGTTIDLADTTSVRVLGRDAVRLETGKIYASVTPLLRGDQDLEYAAPFSLETSAARYVLQEANVEVNASPKSSQPWTKARVDSGAVHVFNNRGHVLGRKGQEISAEVYTSPVRRKGFRSRIWRGRHRTHRGLPYGKGNPVVISDEDTHKSFSAEYGLALAHTGEIDLRGIYVTRGAAKGDLLELWRDLMNEVTVLRRGGLRNAPNPRLGAAKALQRPASGRIEHTVPERSAAVAHLLAEARAARKDRPLVVVSSGAHTDLASAWLLDHSISDRVVVATRAVQAAWDQDAWAATIVLAKFRCVICNVGFPGHTLQFSRLNGTRWEFLNSRTKGGTDFSQFASVTVPGFVKTVQRARFIPGKTPSDFGVEPDPNGKTWLVKQTEPLRLAREYEATFMRDAGSP